MNQRIILQIRLSRRWVEGSPQTVESLAQYLYSLYSFLGLADPSAIFGWATAQDSRSGAPYLILIENPSAPEETRESLPTPKQIKVIEDLGDNGNAPKSLSEDELDPSL